MKTAYLVVGEHGEYSDRMEWYVAVYFDERQANEHCEKANAAVVGWYEKSYGEREAFRNPFDLSGHELAYDMQSYSVQTVPFVDSVEEYTKTA